MPANPKPNPHPTHTPQRKATTKRWLVVAIILALVVAFGIGGYFGYNALTKKKTDTPISPQANLANGIEKAWEKPAEIHVPHLIATGMSPHALVLNSSPTDTRYAIIANTKGSSLAIIVDDEGKEVGDSIELPECDLNPELGGRIYTVDNGKVVCNTPELDRKDIRSQSSASPSKKNSGSSETSTDNTATPSPDSQKRDSRTPYPYTFREQLYADDSVVIGVTPKRFGARSIEAYSPGENPKFLWKENFDVPSNVTVFKDGVLVVSERLDQILNFQVYKPRKEPLAENMIPSTRGQHTW